MMNNLLLEKSLIDKLEDLRPIIGNTPLYKISKMVNNPRVEVYAKLEWQQFGMSVKTRAAWNIIRRALKYGELSQDKRLLDASSGNTGLAFAAIGAHLGLGVTLCIPENVALHKKTALEALGAEVIYTSPYETTDGAQQKALELAAAYPEKYYYADQYSNPANWEAHILTTAEEIWDQTDGRITHFVAGLGTTGTFTGTTRGLREKNFGLEAIAVQPDIAMHGLEGWKHLETAKVPAIYDESLADSFLYVDTSDAYAVIRAAAQNEGLILSPSSAANLSAAIELSEQIDEGVIVTVFPDSGTNYQDVMNVLFNQNQ